MAHIVIIGNGITGITTARHIRKLSDHEITVISAESDHFYSRTALMYIYMGHLTYEHTKPYEDWFWTKNRINLVRGFVSEIDTDSKLLKLNGKEPIRYDKLVIATGAKSNKFGWKGQDLQGVQSLYNLQDLELLEKNSKNVSRAVIVGGGLIGIELAEMLLSRKIQVTFLVREKTYWGNILPIGESKLVEREIRKHGVDLRLDSQLKEILPDENGRARAIFTGNDEEIPCQLVGLTAGVSPNIDIVKQSKISTNRGVIINEFLETSVSDVYAAGDCAEIVENGKPRVEQLWYTGRMQGEALAQTICGKRTKYDRGIWFNSAKFFDIEYQTYGFVANASRENESSLYWEDPKGEKCLHLVYSSIDHTFIGMNSFGIRYRQNIFQKWISEKRTVEFVLEHLGEANFDPEFFHEFESKIIAQYNSQNKSSLTLKRKRGLFSFAKV